jgi:hypothetical protein
MHSSATPGSSCIQSLEDCELGIGVVHDPSDYYVRGPGVPAAAARLLASKASLHRGWRSKRPTPVMETFKTRMLWATRAGSWTQGGMAIRHLRHYLENTGVDYDADMPGLLENSLIRGAYDELIDIARGFAADLRPGESFHAKNLRQIVPRSGSDELASAAALRDRDAWYSVGTFQAWVDGTVHPTGTTLRLHMVDFYDWDQTHFTVPIPHAFCSRAENPLVRWALDKGLSDLRDYGKVQVEGCKITADDTLMHELHLMGLAKNYLTRGVHSLPAER